MLVGGQYGIALGNQQGVTYSGAIVSGSQTGIAIFGEVTMASALQNVVVENCSIGLAVLANDGSNGNAVSHAPQ